MPKEQFAIEFQLLLDEFDGTTASDYFDFYFCRCPLNRSSFKCIYIRLYLNFNQKKI